MNQNIAEHIARVANARKVANTASQVAHAAQKADAEAYRVLTDEEDALAKAVEDCVIAHNEPQDGERTPTC
jgi:hypothetical protein